MGFVRRAVSLALLGSVFATCGGDRLPSGSGAISPTPTPAPHPDPTAPHGVIQDLQAARDIIAYNQEASAGASYRKRGVTCRWEPPIRVYVAAGVDRAAVVDAMEDWASRIGITYLLIDEDAGPRILVRPGDDGLGTALARGGVDGTDAVNTAQSGIVVLRPDVAVCGIECRSVFIHELGHALGFFDHSAFFGVMSGDVPEIVGREQAMMTVLYTLPHGAKVAADGSWQVVLQ